METLLDDNVNQNVELELERGGIPLIVQLMARNFRFECGLVYVSEPGYTCYGIDSFMLFRDGVPRHAIIKKFVVFPLPNTTRAEIEDFLLAGTTFETDFMTDRDNDIIKFADKQAAVERDTGELEAAREIYSQ
ncbi:hypothetical protein Tco_1158065, partial [Tanacetum coccineum]